MTESTAEKPGNELILTTHGVNYGVPQNDNATVVFMGSEDFLGNALAQVRAYVETHGTLKNLTIVGHGDTLEIASEKKANELKIIGIPDFLEGLKIIQSDLGKKVAERIVFDACDTMTHPSPAAVEYMRDSAKDLGAQIVGATTEVHYVDNGPGKAQPKAGLIVQFSPDRTVHRDKLSASPTRIAGGNGGTGITDSRSFAASASRSSPHRSLPVHRRDLAHVRTPGGSTRPTKSCVRTLLVSPESSCLCRLNSIEPPWYGPVCPVVWEGWRRETSPYPDL